MHELLLKILYACDETTPTKSASSSVGFAARINNCKVLFARKSNVDRCVAEIWWEVVMYTEALVSVWAEAGHCPHSLLFSWASLARLLPMLEQVPDLLGVRLPSSQSCLMSTLLKLEVGPQAESVAWTKVAEWGMATVFGWSQSADPGGFPWIRRESSLTMSCKFIMWLATCFMKGFPVGANWQNGKHYPQSHEGIFPGI